MPKKFDLTFKTTDGNGFHHILELGQILFYFGRQWHGKIQPHLPMVHCTFSTFKANICTPPNMVFIKYIGYDTPISR